MTGEAGARRVTTSSAIPLGSDAVVPQAVGAAAASVWGDETEIAEAAVALASRRISKASDPKATARPASELLADAGETITPDGLEPTRPYASSKTFSLQQPGLKTIP